MPWYVLHTKPRNEKKVALRLQELGITAYCPTRVEMRQWSDRKKKVEVPLLPSMVLVNLDDKLRAKVFDVPGAVRYMFWMGKPAVVTDVEVTALKEVELDKKAGTVKVDVLEVGEEIDMDAIGFKAQKGTVKYVSGNQCWVMLKSLGFVVKIEL
ncbi:UpxY family transcription antiterminator [Mangrovimonas aestuarii]|uniref:UpxY family transcription antiterminator n=1 Tax=Mangrovimonas aestuarii TaxID=3018443 RepID=UPI0023785E67|nr:UpxY family transcription antiterminator [Mangrovimonas aestuarii]